MEALLIPAITPSAAGVLLDLSLVTVTALVFHFSASLEVFF